jgi:DNA modification methylase
MELNKVHNIDFLNNTLPDKCAKLIIADPPYYKTKGDFDFIWKTFEDYLVDVEKWCLECKRILADNGTILWYGDAKNIAYSQIIFDKHFNLLSNVTCHIYDRQTNKITTEDARTFISTTERILMYSTDFDVDFNVDIRSDKNNFLPIKKYMRDERTKCGLSASRLKEKTGLPCNLKLIGMYFGDAQWQLPTKENYEMIQKTGYWQKPFEELREEFEKLREEFDLQRRPFNPIEQYKMDVLRVSQEGHITGKYDHDTVKPEKLTRILIQTCSRENDLVVVPFAGSGTECAMSAKEKRPFIGYEITEKHALMSQKRANKILSEPTMF